MRKATLGIGTLFALGLLALSQGASATPCSVDGPADGKGNVNVFTVDPSSDCGYLGENDDYKYDELNVAISALFGHDFYGIDKDEDGDSTNDREDAFIVPDVDWGNSLSGNFGINNDLFDEFSAFVVVLKASKEAAAFLVDLEGLTLGDDNYWYGRWSITCTPGPDEDRCSPNGISHMSLYGKKGDGEKVPEPGSLALLGLGLAGLGVGRRRRKVA